MSVVHEIIVPLSESGQASRKSLRELMRRKALSPAAAVQNDQIHALVQQLFFSEKSNAVCHVGFAPVEGSTATATLCLEVATTLAESHRYDVGLIDANTEAVSLQRQLQLDPPSPDNATWLAAPHLRIVPRQNWLQDDEANRATERDLARLRELTSEFDFSILWCAPVSWLTASVARTCDGLVLVLAANKTRRIVAAQARDQMRQAQVTLLGTVLAERRFPVPQSLYKNL
jgi:Mrp family chromosome partitioning ATPase